MGTLDADPKPRRGVDASRAMQAIGAFRAFGGASFWIAPDLTARAYRSGPVARDRLSARLAGAREVALALGPLLSDGEDRSRWLRLGLACDFADALATLIGRRRVALDATTRVPCHRTRGDGGRARLREPRHAVRANPLGQGTRGSHLPRHTARRRSARARNRPPGAIARRSHPAADMSIYTRW